MSTYRTPAEIAHYIPEPRIVLLGCRPYPPVRREGQPCPVCKGLIGLARLASPPGEPAVYRGDDRDRVTFCEACASLSPENEANARAQRLGVESLERGEAAERELRDEIRGRKVLSERERRRYWFGANRRGYRDGRPEVVNRAAAGRKWLAEIGQTPDWSLVLDKHGNVVGRHEGREGPGDGVEADS